MGHLYFSLGRAALARFGCVGLGTRNGREARRRFREKYPPHTALLTVSAYYANVFVELL